ncbi:MAG TPA: ABC transporter permease [Rhodanobacteraceae bacterium]|nr:ABC transporter permease [Rhodanobacteraceae bacterium]
MSATEAIAAAPAARPRPVGRGAQRARRVAANVALGLSGLGVLLVLWALGVHALERSMPLAHLFTPKAAIVSLYELLRQGELTTDIIASLRRVGVSLALALAAGIPTGLAVGSSRLFDATTRGAFQFVRMISPLSWMPIAVMLFGIGDAPIYFLLAITAVWPIVLNTASGVRQLDPRWLALARSLSATRTEVLFKIILPGILGHILTGVRIAIGIIWILLVPCEMLGVTSGLGYFVLDTRDRLAYSELMAVILLIGILGFTLDVAASRIHRHWARTA